MKSFAQRRVQSSSSPIIIVRGNMKTLCCPKGITKENAKKLLPAESQVFSYIVYRNDIILIERLVNDSHIITSLEANN